jgi:hypothetical protein
MAEQHAYPSEPIPPSATRLATALKDMAQLPHEEPLAHNVESAR